MNVPENLRYTTSHEWVLMEKNTASVGITDFAQDQLSALSYIELPSVGDTFTAGEQVAVVESVKAASDVYAPVTGTVVEVNEELEAEPGRLNSDPYGKGWLFKVQPVNLADVDQLLSASAYRAVMPGDGST
jgi:glycine cleavage system H protein